MELIHIVRTRHVQSNQQSSSLEHERQIKKTFGLLKSVRTAKGAQKTLDCRLLGVSKMVEPIGIEPMTFWLQTRRSPS